MLTQEDIETIRLIIREEVKTQLKPIRRDIRKLRKDLDFILVTLDKDHVELKKRVDKLEAKYSS